MKVALLGYGRFGAAFASVLHDAGVEVKAWDSRDGVPDAIRATSTRDLVNGATHVVLAVPVSAMTVALGAIAPDLSPSQLVMDVGSVKVHPEEAMRAALGRRIPWVGTHPLFGPVSLARAERPLRVVVTPNREHPEAADRASAFFKGLGCEVILQSAEQHDRMMARTHALAFFVAKGILAIGGGGNEPFAPPSYQAIARTVELVRADAGHLFRAIQQENPFSEETRRSLLDALREIHEDLELPDDEDDAPTSNRAASFMFAIPNLDERLPELLETRAQIDALDREMVALLARRAELADRAATAKESIGYGVVDPAREAQVIEARREWAIAHGLDGNAVEEIFRAVLRFSRAMQGRRSVER